MGYFIVLFPGGQTVGGALIVTGKGLSFVGSIIEIAGDVNSERYLQASVKAIITVSSGMASEVVEKAVKKDQITEAAKAVFELTNKSSSNVIEEGTEEVLSYPKELK